MVNVIKITQTCLACPSQWEGVTDDGKMIYIRYRYGGLSVRISQQATKDIFDAVSGKEIIGVDIGDEYDGYISYDEMKDRVKSVLTLPEPPE